MLSAREAIEALPHVEIPGRKADARSPLNYSITFARDFKIRQNVAYHIKGLWQQDTFAVTWGPSGDGKSTVTVDMVLHVVAGREAWCGRRVNQGGFVYLGAEGPYSIECKFLAMCAHMGLDITTLPLALLSGALHLLNDPDNVIAAIREAANKLRKEFGVEEVGLVVDTLARSAPGMDENGPLDMGKYVGVCDRIRRELGMCVVIVHHAGKDVTRGARGHGALKAAADCELLICDNQISIEKLRDGPTGGSIPFTLHPMELAKDADGDAVTACYVEYGAEFSERTKATKKHMPDDTRIALTALKEAIQDGGEAMPQTSTLASGIAACSVEQWRRRYYGRIADRDQEAQKKAFQRAKAWLTANNVIGAWESRVWIW